MIPQSSYSAALDPAAVQEFAASRDVVESGWRDLWRDSAEFGLLSLGLPTEYGGLDATTMQSVEAYEALGYGLTDNGLTMGLNSQLWTVQHPLCAFGTPEQKKRYLPGLISGELIGAFALTEADAGSDAMNMAATAEKSGSDYVLNGEKVLIGMATAADLALVFARTAPDRGAWGVSAFLVDADLRGFVQGPAEAKHGLASLPFGPMRFEDCIVPEAQRLGPEGAGAGIFQSVIDWERAFILAPHVGTMRRQIDECTTYTTGREVFGAPISSYQSVSNRLADMMLRYETSQLMLHKAARLMDEGALTTLHAAMTNLHISEAFLANSIDAFRSQGGRGYLSSSRAGTEIADALGGVIYSGTSDIQRQIIARLTGRGSV